MLTFLLDLTLEKFCQLEKTLSSSVTNCSPSITGFYWAPLCSTYSPGTWDPFMYLGYFISACVKVSLYSDKRNTRTSSFRLPKTCQDLGDLELLFSTLSFLLYHISFLPGHLLYFPIQDSVPAYLLSWNINYYTMGLDWRLLSKLPHAVSTILVIANFLRTHTSFHFLFFWANQKTIISSPKWLPFFFLLLLIIIPPSSFASHKQWFCCV